MKNLIQKLMKTAPLVHPAAGFKSRFRRLKYVVRGMALARCSQEWFHLLEQPELAVVASHHPYIFCKLQRPYLNRCLNARQRLEVLQQHYQFVATRFSRFEMESVYATQGLLLARIPLKEVGNFGVHLSYGRQEKEGDLLLHLASLDTSKVLFELSFCITRCETHGGEVFIGGLQGNKWNCDKDLIIAITRALHGLRPKALLIFMLQQLATGWEITRLRAVSDDAHIYRHPHKRKDLMVSYDELWIESGGTLADDGMFNLPARFVPREISTLKVNKRQMYKRRYRLLAEIAGQMTANLPAAIPGAMPANGLESLPASLPVQAVCHVDQGHGSAGVLRGG